MSQRDHERSENERQRLRRLMADGIISADDLEDSSSRNVTLSNARKLSLGLNLKLDASKFASKPKAKGKKVKLATFNFKSIIFPQCFKRDQCRAFIDSRGMRPKMGGSGWSRLRLRFRFQPGILTPVPIPTSV